MAPFGDAVYGLRSIVNLRWDISACDFPAAGSFPARHIGTLFLPYSVDGGAVSSGGIAGWKW